jgi:uncharacterized protein GlcG (DUF336 family)
MEETVMRKHFLMALVATSGLLLGVAVIGGIGVSGGTGAQDGVVAKAGADTVTVK